MAIKFFDCNGYGQIEPNQVSFTRDGRIEAQCELDPEKFAAHFPMTAEEAPPAAYRIWPPFLRKQPKKPTAPTPPC